MGVRRIVIPVIIGILILGTLGLSQDAFATTVIDAGPDTTIDEGDVFSSSGSFTDVDAVVWTATVDYGDGTGFQVLTLNPDKTFELNHLYPQDNIFVNGRDAFDVPIPFEVTVTINDGAVDTIATVFVTVNNVLPTISPIDDVTLNEGDVLMVSGSFTDPGDEPQFEGRINYGFVAEPLDDHLPINPDNTFDLEQLYDQNGMFTVVVQIGDRSDFTTATEEFIVTVNNVDPFLTLGSDATINEGGLFTSSGSFSDPGTETWTITADYGDGSDPVGIAFEEDLSFTLNHIYQDSGVFTVSVTVNDGDSEDTKTQVVTVNNVAPTLDAGSDATIDEGDTFVSVGSFLDVIDESITITADYGDGSSSVTLTPNDDNSFDLNHLYSNDGIFTVTVTVDDGDDSTSDTATVTVNNVAPSISVSDQLVNTTREFTAEGSFVDPGDDSWTATVDYGEDPSSETLILNPDKSFSLAHNYSSDEAYTVTVTIFDDDTSSVSSFTAAVFVNTDGPGVGLISPPDTTTTFNGGATFTTTGQDIWGPVSDLSGSSSWELFTPQTWNERDGDGKFVTLAGFRLGASIDAGTSGHLKLTATASSLTGTTGIDYPGTMVIEYLDANTFLAGESVPIGNSWNLNTANAKINAETTSGDLQMDLDFALDANVDSEVCLLDGCSDPLDAISDISFDMHPGNTKLFKTSAFGPVEIPPLLAGFIGLQGNFDPIAVEPSTTSVDGNTGTIVAESTKQFSNMILDIDSVASKLGAPPLERSLVFDGIGGAYDVFDADAIVDFKAHQKLTFDTGVLTTLNFDTPVDGVTGEVVGVTTNGAGKVTSVTFRDGDQIEIVFPQGETNPITVTPTIFLDPSNTKLHQFTELVTESNVSMKAGELFIGMPGFNVTPEFTDIAIDPHLSDWECHGILCVNGHFHHSEFHEITVPAVNFPGITLSLGPLWKSGPQGEQIVKNVIANKAFTLGGFNTVTLDSFELDPEVPPTAVIGGPYVVPEGSVIEVDASGSFDIDLPPQPLTYSWDLDNDGTFETNGIKADFTLGIDGPTTHPISLKVCDEFNCDTDSTVVEVTNVEPTVHFPTEPLFNKLEMALILKTTDPSVPDTLAGFDYQIDWDDKTQIEESHQDAVSLFTHIYEKSGKYTIKITATDKDDGVSEEAILEIFTPFAKLLDDIDDLVNDGSLKKGQGNSLKSKINAVLKDITKDRITPACNVAGALINEVDELVKTNKLTFQQGRELFAKIELAKDQIGCNGKVVIVEKQTMPVSEPITQFTFTGDIAGNIGDNQEIRIRDVDVGIYSTTEVEGNLLNHIICTDNNSSGDLNTSTATFRIEDEDNAVKCVFFNTNPDSINDLQEQSETFTAASSSSTTSS